MLCARCGTVNDNNSSTCIACGASLVRAEAQQGDSTGGVIPYKNPPALVAYYLGLFSAFPMVGLLLGTASVILGVLGLKKRRDTPQVKGTVHAWIGIGCGSLGILVWGGLIVLMVLAATGALD